MKYFSARSQMKSYLADEQAVQRTCPVCDSSQTQLIVTADRDFLGLGTVRCLVCGTAFTNPYFAPDAIARFYQRLYRDAYKHSPDPVAYRRRCAELVDRAHWFLSLSEANGLIPDRRFKWLDVGCGGGILLQEVKKRYPYAVVHGVEPDIKYREDLRHQGYDVRPDTLDFRNEAPFDVVTSIHVVEHLIDPRPTLEAISALLAPTGSFLIDVPDVAAYSHLDDLHFAHCNHFSIHTLRLLLERSGFFVAHAASHAPPTLPESVFAIAKPAVSPVLPATTPDPHGDENMRRIELLPVSLPTYVVRRATAAAARRLQGILGLETE